MIIFKKVRFKNFMSYGNAMAEIELDKHHISVIVGKNGHGKSVIISAICYALFDKPFNDANKSKIINSINGKNLLVELEFTVNGVEYLVRRGQKPSVFEIYRDTKLIPQESSSKLYQEVLENQILKFNIKTLKQTILIGTASFTPFMELSANDRRSVVENVLGVEVLSSMNKIIKIKESNNSNSLRELNTVLNNIKIKVNSEKSQIETIERLNNDNKDKYVNQIQEANDEIASLTSSIKDSEKELKKLAPFQEKYIKIRSLRNELKTELSNINVLIGKAKKELKFIESHDLCPMCNQLISPEHKTEIRNKTESSLSDYSNQINDVNAKIEKYDALEEKLYDVIQNISTINNNISSYNSKINYLNQSISSWSEELAKPRMNIDAINEHKQNIIKMAEQAKIKLLEKNNMMKESQLISNCQLLLKDSGIKSSIVNQYLPLINQKINQYLDDFEFFLTVELDSQFNEVIRARDRDIFSYQNLSQGERRRLDLAIILTWRYIISTRSDFNTNLLFIDELLESGLDADGIESVMNSLRSMTSNNIFIITHNQSIQDSRVDKYYKVTKENQFSVIE